MLVLIPWEDVPISRLWRLFLLLLWMVFLEDEYWKSYWTDMQETCDLSQINFHSFDLVVFCIFLNNFSLIWEVDLWRQYHDLYFSPSFHSFQVRNIFYFLCSGKNVWMSDGFRWYSQVSDDIVTCPVPKSPVDVNWLLYPSRALGLVCLSMII